MSEFSVKNIFLRAFINYTHRKISNTFTLFPRNPRKPISLLRSATAAQDTTFSKSISEYYLGKLLLE
ncbi:hypothetical protein PIROE2DRAFT_17277 [Piromyces sp. E2]|nr:hypothetical protein PIROE2DRAFT_17277 [Piromyces sp. E2]|eukprot:OUM57667.1 hypothetical protein PIROE2DRAFT_17277 [Piromyces sp. E2]